MRSMPKPKTRAHHRRGRVLGREAAQGQRRRSTVRGDYRAVEAGRKELNGFAKRRNFLEGELTSVGELAKIEAVQAQIGEGACRHRFPGSSGYPGVREGRRGAQGRPCPIGGRARIVGGGVAGGAVRGVRENALSRTGGRCGRALTGPTAGRAAWESSTAGSSTCARRETWPHAPAAAVCSS